MKKFARILAVVMVLMTIFSTVAFAADELTEWKSAEDVNKDTLSKYYQSAGTGTQAKLDAVLKSYDNDTAKDVTSVSLGNETYSVPTDKLNSLYASVYTVYSKEKLKDKVSEMSVNFDTEADTAGAAKMLSGLQGPVQLIVGILSYIVVIGMGLFTALDICYIVIPVFREKTDETAHNTRNKAMVKETANGSGQHMRFITDDAYFAVRTCTIDSGKNPLMVYLKKRILAYVMVAVVLYILLTGNINIITNIAINVISGLIDIISGLGN